MECPINIKSIWSIVSYKASVSLLIFCLDDLSIGVSEVLKSPTVTVLLPISSFIAVSSCLMYCGAPMLGAYIFIIVMSSFWRSEERRVGKECRSRWSPYH